MFQAADYQDDYTITVKGRLVGVLGAPVGKGLTCIIESSETLAPLMCAVRTSLKSDLDHQVGRTVLMTGEPMYTDDGRISRLSNCDVALI